MKARRCFCSVQRIELGIRPPAGHDVGREVADRALRSDLGEVRQRIVEREPVRHRIVDSRPVDGASRGAGQFLAGERHPRRWRRRAARRPLRERDRLGCVGFDHPAGHVRNGHSVWSQDSQHDPAVWKRRKPQTVPGTLFNAAHLAAKERVGRSPVKVNSGRPRSARCHRRRHVGRWLPVLRGYGKRQPNERSRVAGRNVQSLHVDGNQDARLANQLRIPLADGVDGCPQAGDRRPTGRDHRLLDHAGIEAIAHRRASSNRAFRTARPIDGRNTSSI